MQNNNEHIKIFFIDLDGTLLDEKTKKSHNISKTNLDAIKKQIDNGKKVVISTGRLGIQAKKHLDTVNAKYAVTGNGSIILKDGEIIKKIHMGLREQLMIFDFAKKHKLVLKLDDSRIGFGAFSWLQRSITKMFNYNPVKHFNFEMFKEYSKIVLWGKRKSKMKKLSKIIREELPNLSIVSSSSGWTIEVTDSKATKGLGNLFVAKEYGIIDGNQMLHIGDTMNDSTAAEHMKLVAMKNSTKSLLNATTLRGPHYKKGGVAKILNGEYKDINKK